MTNPMEMKAGDQTLTRAATMVANAKSDFDRLSTTLSHDILAQQARWQGQGGASFFRLHAAWTEKQNRIVNALEEFESALTSTERLNVATDQAQSDFLARNSGRLDGIPHY